MKNTKRAVICFLVLKFHLAKFSLKFCFIGTCHYGLKSMGLMGL